MRLFHEELKLYYEQKDEHITICEGDHYIESVDIPASINGISVTAIQKKAFLGCKLLKTVRIPDTIESIGDFAFAMCDHLREVYFPSKSIRLGASLFKNDSELFAISTSLSDKHASILSAAAIITMNSEYLLDIPHIGEDEWYKMWDQKLLDIIGRRDDEDYHMYVLCGEEDLHFDYEQYIEYIQELKAGLCFLRLLYNNKLSEETHARLTDYMNSLMIPSQDSFAGTTTAGKKAIGHIVLGSNPVFNKLLSAHGDDEEYFDLLIREGIITRDNREALLSIMGDRHPQMKAYLINSFEDSSANPLDDFFGNLML